MRRWDVEVIAGNVATAEAVDALVDAGADAVKVGDRAGLDLHHPGRRRRRRPADHRHLRLRRGRRRPGVTVIADGGIQHSGDIAKAIAAGANA